MLGLFDLGAIRPVVDFHLELFDLASDFFGGLAFAFFLAFFALLQLLLLDELVHPVALDVRFLQLLLARSLALPAYRARISSLYLCFRSSSRFLRF